MGKNVLKYGGKSGLLPKVKPIFNKPIRPPTVYELANEKTLETGYAEGVPLPIIKGKTIPRQQRSKKVVTVAERIQQIKFPELTLKEMNKLPADERDAHRREFYKAQFLKEAYLEEEQRLQKIDELKQMIHEKKLKRSQEAHEEEVLEHDRSVKGLPTMQALLDNGLIKQRTPEETELLKQQRILNRKTNELQQKEAQAEKLLELYHAAGKFITTEKQLEEAIHQAFEVDVGVFEGHQTTIEAKLANKLLGYMAAEVNESLIADTILGEINGKPGLKQVKQVLDGTREQNKRNAQLGASK